MVVELLDAGDAEWRFISSKSVFKVLLMKNLAWNKYPEFLVLLSLDSYALHLIRTAGIRRFGLEMENL